MVTYGDWRQDDDMTLTDAVDVSNTTNAAARVTGNHGASIDEEEVNGSDYYVVTSSDLSDAVVDAVDAAGPGGAPEAVPVGTSYYWGYDFLLTPTRLYSRWGARTWGWRWNVTAREGFEYYPNFYGPGDPDAIGVEFQGGPPYDPADPFPFAPAPPVGLALSPSTVVAADVRDESNTTTHEVTSGWTTQIRAAYELGDFLIAERDDGGLRTTEFSVHTEALGQAISLDFLADHGWECDLYTLTPAFVAPYDLPTPGDSSYSAQGQVSYGWVLDELTVLTTVRPPVYRFVYASNPIRQTTHRDDHLAGGAYQTWPQPGSAQLSNVTFGEYL